MSRTTKRGRRIEVTIPQMWLHRLRTQARKAGTRMTPMAGNARDLAAQRIEDARLWAAPKLDQAAQSVEEQIAPIVSAFLAELARRIEVSTARRPRRRWPMAALCAGVAVGAVGVAMYRSNTRRWADREGIEETASEVGKWVGDKAEQARGKAEQVRDEAVRSADEVRGKRP